MRKFTILLSVLFITMLTYAQTQLATPTVGVATSITNVGFTANWTPADANALSFDVKVYDATVTLIKTVNVTGAATALAAISGLTASTAYTFTVTAKGDGTTYTNSLESSPASVSTSAAIALTSPVVGTPLLLPSIVGFTAKWTAVTNASSYIVKVYNSTPALVVSVPVTGATTASAAITGLLQGTSYTYTVIAVGDGINYLNSPESSASVVISTLTLLVKEGFSDWTAANASTTLVTNVTKFLYDGVTSGTYTFLNASVTPTQSASAPGSAGRISFAGSSSYLQLPELPTVGDVVINANAGTANNGYKLQYLNAGVWTDATTVIPQQKTIVQTNTSHLTFTEPTTIRIMNGQSGSTNYYDVQVSAYVSPLPALSTPTGVNATSILNQGFTANWTPVTNAISYVVRVSQGSTLITSKVVTGQSSSSAVISGLNSGNNYTFTVYARADNTTYSTSAQCTPVSVATIGLVTPVLQASTNITSSGFTANWTPSANAIGYDVKTYFGTTLVSTTSVTGQSTATASVTGLSMGTSYTYTVTAKGDGITNLDSSPTLSTGIITLQNTLASINTNFGDGTWGLLGNGYTFNSTTVPASGFYPASFSINGIDIAQTLFYNSSLIGPYGEVITNYLKCDKGNLGAMITLPTFASVGEIEIRANNVSTTTDRTFNLQQLISGTWTNVGAGSGGIYTTGLYDLPISQQIMAYKIPITTNTTNAKFRILNTATQSGGINIMQVIVRPAASLPSLAAPTGTLSAANTSSNGFTANWPNVVTNATGYKVNVYSNKLKTLVTSATVPGNASLSLAITGLQADSTYTYGVVGLGDNLTYSDGLILMATTPVITNLAAPIVTGPSNVSLTGSFTANWAAVNNASSYDLTIYDETQTQIGTPINVPAGTLSYNVSVLNSNTSYKYTVTAKGDGVLHLTSVPSAPVYVSLYTGLNNLNENSFITASGKTILTSEIGLIQVFNLQGSKIMETQGVNKLDTNLISGLYMVRFTNQKGQSSLAKVIIK